MTVHADLVRRLREHKDAPESPPTAGEFMQTVGAWIRRACELQAEAADAIERLSGKAEPVATMYQHRETGRTLFVGADEQDRYLPSYDCIGPLYLHPAAPAPDEYNRKLRQQLEQEWCDVQALKRANAVPARKRCAYCGVPDGDGHTEDCVHPGLTAPAPDPLRHIKVFNAAYNNAPAPDDARDAARYRWLRRGYRNLTTMQAARGLGLDLRECFVDSPEKLDQVIDAAMKDQP